MELLVTQQIYYSNKEAVPVREIAESLLALEDVIKHTPDVLESLFPGTKIQSVDVFIKELKTDSIWEDIIVKFIFGSEQKFDQFIQTLREKIGMDSLMDNPQLLSAIILVLILSGGAYYLGKDKTATPEQRTTNNDRSKQQHHHQYWRRHGGYVRRGIQDSRGKRNQGQTETC